MRVRNKPVFFLSRTPLITPLYSPLKLRGDEGGLQEGGRLKGRQPAKTRKSLFSYMRRDFLEKLRERIDQLKTKRPGYGEILDFYRKVKEAQDKVKASVRIDPIKLKKEWKELLTKEGFSLIQKEDLPLDIESSVKLFETLCQIGKDANPHMAEQVRKIREALDDKKIDLKKLLKKGVTEQGIDQMADELGLDKKVFSFLIQCSIKPSIEAGMEQLRSELDLETWPKGYCPVCGSLPSLSLLKEEVGKRYLLCSFCGYQWRIDRIF
jgi:FdhE protein